MNYNPDKHRRRSIRLKGYDYSSAGLYFITICTQKRAHLFGEIIKGEMQYNSLAKKVFESWDSIADHFPNTENHEFIIMPNHIHGIIEILDNNENSEKEIGKFQSPSKTIGSIIRGFKIGTKKGIRELYSEIPSERSSSTGEKSFAPTEDEIKKSENHFASTEILKKIDFSKSIWHRNYYEHIIRNNSAYRNIANYIRNNPKKWKEDKFFKEED